MIKQFDLGHNFFIYMYFLYRLKALAHYNWNCKKSSYRPYTLQRFFTTATIFSTVLYMDNDFYKDFFRKIFVKIFVVCEGLNRWALTFFYLQFGWVAKMNFQIEMLSNSQTFFCYFTNTGWQISYTKKLTVIELVSMYWEASKRAA